MCDTASRKCMHGEIADFYNIQQLKRSFIGTKEELLMYTSSIYTLGTNTIHQLHVLWLELIQQNAEDINNKVWKKFLRNKEN